MNEVSPKGNNAPNLNQAKALDPSTEQLIHQVVQALMAPAQKGECRCHWIDPQKTPILVWKSAKEPNTLVMKINQQKFIGLARSDKNNELYWKFRDFYEGGAEAPQPTPPTAPNPTGPKTDLPSVETPSVQTQLSAQERSPKTFSQKEVEHSPAPFSQKEIEESEAVKKFREKYGSPNSSQTSQ